MATASAFEIGSTYNFNTYGSGILGYQTEVAVLGVVNADVANTYQDVAALHNSIWSYVDGSESQPDADYKSYDYLVFRTKNGTIQAYGLPWIVSNSVELIGSRSMVISIPNQSSEDVELVRKALVGIGKNTLDIKLV